MLQASSISMKTVNKSVLIWYSPREMYSLVTHVDAYPQFLPWCDHAQVVSTDAEGITAEVGISFGGIRQTFITRNTHVPDTSVGMKLVKGPFSQLEGEWRFLPVGSGTERACRVELTLHYGFDNVALSALVGPVFDRIANSMVEAFVARAEQVYG